MIGKIKLKSQTVVNNEHAEAESLRDLSQLEAMKSEFKGAKQINFMPRKKVRRIYVNRHAISSNVNYGTKHPTIVINDNGKETLCHGIIMYGPAVMGFDPTNEDGKASIETNAKIVAFVYEKSAEEYRQILKRGC